MAKYICGIFESQNVKSLKGLLIPIEHPHRIRKFEVEFSLLIQRDDFVSGFKRHSWPSLVTDVPTRRADVAFIFRSSTRFPRCSSIVLRRTPGRTRERERHRESDKLPRRAGRTKSFTETFVLLRRRRRRRRRLGRRGEAHVHVAESPDRSFLSRSKNNL